VRSYFVNKNTLGYGQFEHTTKTSCSGLMVTCLTTVCEIRRSKSYCTCGQFAETTAIYSLEHIYTISAVPLPKSIQHSTLYWTVEWVFSWLTLNGIAKYNSSLCNSVISFYILCLYVVHIDAVVVK